MQLIAKSKTIDISIIDNHSLMIATLEALQTTDVDITVYDDRLTFSLFTLQEAIDYILTHQSKQDTKTMSTTIAPDLTFAQYKATAKLSTATYKAYLDYCDRYEHIFEEPNIDLYDDFRKYKTDMTTYKAQLNR